MKSYASPNRIINTALRSILPVAHLEYAGSEQTYGIFRWTNRNKSIRGSGKNRVIDVYGYLDIISPEDLSRESSIVVPIEAALIGAGVRILDIWDGPYDPDLGEHHCEISIVVSMEVPRGG